MAEPCDDPCASLAPDALVQVCARGGELVVCRAPYRTANLFAAEFDAAVSLLGLRSRLQQLLPGLWLLSPPMAGDDDDASRQRVSRLLRWLPSMGGVRLCGELMMAARSGPELVAAARPLHGFGATTGWSLAYEVHYPAADHAVVPFARVHGAASLLIGLHTALGAGYTDEVLPRRLAASAPQALVLLHCKSGLLLLRERPLDRASPRPHIGSLNHCNRMGREGRDRKRSADECRNGVANTDWQDNGIAATRTVERGPSGSDTASEPPPALVAPGPSTTTPTDALGSDGLETSTACLPWWLTPWAVRPFSFSAALDPLIAIAALNLAACAHRTRMPSDASSVLCGEASNAELDDGLRSGPLRGLSVYDPCAGSGTILAAATAHGATAVSGSELRAEFLEGARSNLASLRAVSDLEEPVADLFEHDATEPMSPERVASLRCDLVVSNPPWGKNLGQPADGAPIVKATVERFPNRTMVWLVNKTTRQELERFEKANIVKVLKLGGVEAVLMHT